MSLHLLSLPYFAWAIFARVSPGSTVQVPSPLSPARADPTASTAATATAASHLHTLIGSLCRRAALVAPGAGPAGHLDPARSTAPTPSPGRPTEPVTRTVLFT